MVRTLAVLGIVAAAGVGCNLGTRSYELRGQALGIDAERREVLLNHEDVPGLMSAMTMPFRVRDARLLEGLRAGDLVTAHLVIRGADAYLTSLERVGSSPLERGISAASEPGRNLLEPGDAVPSGRFLDQSGHSRTFAAWDGQAIAVTFIYTRCPMPAFCPMMDRHFAALQRAVKASASLHHQAHLVSITFDPQHDTPAVLTAHANELDADPAVWTFLTGQQDEIDRFAARFRVSVTREGHEPGNITHNLRTAVLDRNGKLVKIYNGPDWTPQQMLSDLKSIVAGS